MTKISYIGFLTYHAPLGDIENSINTLYCAPNKIYEYSLFDKPMLSTNNPALYEIYKNYHIGKSLDDFSPKNIAKVILELDKHYKEYSSNCNSFYNAIDIEKLILDVINE